MTGSFRTPACLAVSVDVEGHKHVFGIWISDTEGEGAKFWLQVLHELRKRGVVMCSSSPTGVAGDEPWNHTWLAVS